MTTLLYNPYVRPPNQTSAVFLALRPALPLADVGVSALPGIERHACSHSALRAENDHREGEEG